MDAYYLVNARKKLRHAIEAGMPQIICCIDTPVRLANRLKALTIPQYSSDENTEDTNDRQRRTTTRVESGNGAAFAEVVRASMRANEETKHERAASPVAAEAAKAT